VKKKVLLLMACLMVFVIVLVACDNDGSNNETITTGGIGTDGHVDGEGDWDPHSHLDVTWMTILHTANPPTDNVVSLVEEVTNSSIDWIWVPDANRNERITTALASQELAHIMTFTDLQNTSVRNAMDAGMFWELSDFLDLFPNLSQISQSRRDAASIEGKLYGVPLERWATRRGFTMRQDWLDHLGLDVPTTMDELFEVAYAFTHYDPDGNGIDDTFGFIGRTEWINMSFANTLAFMGGPNRWRLEVDGSFTHAYETEEWIANMDWWRRVVDEGLINPDFLVTATADQNQLFAQGQGGMYPNLTNIGMLRDLAEGLHDDDFALVPVNKICNGDGVYRVIGEGGGGAGIGGVFSFPKSEVETEAELMRLLQFIDQLFEEEVHMLLIGGIEGIHYHFNENGAFEIIDNDLWQQDVQPLGQNIASVTRIVNRNANPEIVMRDAQIQENEALVVLNPAGLGLNSPTFNERVAELDQMMNDATTQYVMGALDLDGFLAVLENWRNSGGRQMAEEFAASYVRMNSQ
jgi:putative aldouronate transport system substrate-binding protein